MLDIKLIREKPKFVKQGLQKRQVKPEVIDQLLSVDEKKRKLGHEVDSLRAEQRKAGEQKDIAKAKELKEKIKQLEQQLADVEQQFNDLMFSLPNLPLQDVPVGPDEKSNAVVREWGKKREFKFSPKDYLVLAQQLDLIDTARAAKTSGTRFGILKGEAVLLEFALAGLAFDVLGKEGFVPLAPPVLIKPKAMRAMGYIDTEKDREERYFLEKDELYLVGTSEQSTGPMHQDEVLESKDLPLRYAAFSTCFRREAGSYGKDTKGILRVHQFDKLEMFVFARPEESQGEHRLLVEIQEKLMQALELPYRVVHLASGDMSRPAASTFDIETWLPGQGKYRETHSASNCADFQARRLNIRYLDPKSGKPGFVHMLNGTAFAIGRTLIAVIENYQQEDGSIKVPKALQKYTGFKVIKAHNGRKTN